MIQTINKQIEINEKANRLQTDIIYCSVYNKKLKTY